jgi:hypothetical protein
MRHREERDVPDLAHRVVGEDRLRRLEPHRRLGCVDAEQVRSRSDERHERHHELFAIGSIGGFVTCAKSCLK